MAWWIGALGACIGVAAGLLGAGPSILTVLLLQHTGHFGVRGAIATSLVVVATMSVVALVPYALSDAILWRAALGFGLASMTGAFIGGHISRFIPAKIILVIFYLAMVVASIAMVWESSPRKEGPARALRQSENLVVFAAMGLLIGSLTGIAGLGGGFAVVPLLVVFARAPIRSAIGTSIVVIAMNTIAGLLGHLSHSPIDWRAAIYLGITESLGSLLGVRLGRHLSARMLRRAFAGLMVGVALFLLIGTAVR